VIDRAAEGAQPMNDKLLEQSADRQCIGDGCDRPVSGAGAGLAVELLDEGVACDVCAERVKAELCEMERHFKWRPTRELARSILSGSDRRLPAEQLDALQRMRDLQAEIGREVEMLTDPQYPGERKAVITAWANDLWARSRGHNDVQHMARMDFFEVINSAAIMVREHRLELPEAAVWALCACACGLSYSQYWWEMWRDRESTPESLALFRDAISAWDRGSGWTRAGATPWLELLSRARLIGGKRTLKKTLSLKKQWTGGRRNKEKTLAERFPYQKAPPPAGPAASRRKGKPGPPPATVTLSAEEAARLVDPDVYREELIDRQCRWLRSHGKNVERAGIARMFSDKG
jgi:hypothetical protein